MQNRLSDIAHRVQTEARTCALVLGILFLLVGIAGFIPTFMSIPGTGADAPLNVPDITYSNGYGYVLGLFPTNFLHNAVHITVGILGIAAASSLSGALVFNQGFAIAYIAIAIMGLLPWTNSTFGLMPIFGNNVWFNALTAIAAGYYGFVKPAKAKEKIEESSPSV